MTEDDRQSMLPQNTDSTVVGELSTRERVPPAGPISRRKAEPANDATVLAVPGGRISKPTEAVRIRCLPSKGRRPRPTSPWDMDQPETCAR